MGRYKIVEQIIMRRMVSYIGMSPGLLLDIEYNIWKVVSQ